MSADLRHATDSDGAGQGATYVVTALWDGDRWAVSVPNPGGGGRANTFAASLAEAVPNASEVLGVLLGCWPGIVERDIGLEVHVDPAITERLETARDPWEAAEALRGGGLLEADITAIVLSRVTPASTSAIDVGGPVIWSGGAGESRLAGRFSVEGRHGTEGS